LFASLWVVATQVRASLTIFELSSVKSSWSESSIKAAMHSKLHFKRKRGESERWRRSSAGCERVQALAGEKKAWERVTGRGSYTTRHALHSQESKTEKDFQGPSEKRRRGF
jgi:hypothetical protein